MIGVSVQDIAEELNLDYESYGSTTWRKHIKMAGVEPDNCFYFQHEASVKGRLDFDLSQGDPPPDVALEIDITHKSLDLFSIYARLEAPELWCHESGALKIYHLCDGNYIEANTSLAFPALPIPQLPEIIEAHRASERLAIRRAVRAWARHYVQK